MKILVPVKRVVDHNVRIHVRPDGSGIDTDGVRMSVNPFDEQALEEAVRIREAGLASEVVAVSVGPEKSLEQLHTAMAMGADRAILVVSEDTYTPFETAGILREIAGRECPGLIITGRQSSDGDAGQTGPMLAAMLGWPQGIFASKVAVDKDSVTVVREVEGGRETVELKIPAVITADLRLNEPGKASLAAVLKARKKPVETLKAADLLQKNGNGSVTTLKFRAPEARKRGPIVSGTKELAEIIAAIARGSEQAGRTAMPSSSSPPPTATEKSNSRVLVIAEHDGESLSASTLHTLGAAFETGGTADVLVAGFGCSGAAQNAAAIPCVRKVWLADGRHLKHSLAENMAPVIASLAGGYTRILAPATSFGKDILPRAAALSGCAQISGVRKVVAPDVFERHVYAGNATETVKVVHERIFITVVPASFAPPASCGGNAVIENITVPGDSSLSKFISTETDGAARPELTEARIVVCAGAGIGSAENFGLAGELADTLGAALGTTREAVDRGYAPNELQIGQSGASIAPELYICAGVSGSMQHICGISDAKIIIAVNNDPAAPIFAIADYGIIGDAVLILSELTELINDTL